MAGYILAALWPCECHSFHPLTTIPLIREALHEALGRVQRREAGLRVETVRILRGEYPAAQSWQARMIDKHLDQPLADALPSKLR